MDELMKVLFGCADSAHRAHLLTQSFSEHTALAEFYEDLRTNTDALCEALIALGKLPAPDTAPPILEQLKADYRTVLAMRELADGDQAAESLFDNVGATFLSAIYKLERLM